MCTENPLANITLNDKNMNALSLLEIRQKCLLSPLPLGIVLECLANVLGQEKEI